MKKTISIKGNKITIKVNRGFSQRFGEIYTATNNYGEPKQTLTAYKTEKEAFNNEVKELTQLFS